VSKVDQFHNAENQVQTGRQKNVNATVRNTPKQSFGEPSGSNHFDSALRIFSF